MKGEEEGKGKRERRNKEHTLAPQSRIDLPPNARRYVERIEDIAGVPIDFVGTGQQREAIVIRP